MHAWTCPKQKPTRSALHFASGEAIQAVFHWYRATRIDPVHQTTVPPVTMLTLFLWPPGASNVSLATAAANARHVTGPDRFEVLENARNFALQAEPERISALLTEHLTRNAREKPGLRAR